jgi:EmrB/QacA subfamily drug resistance transporter
MTSGRQSDPEPAPAGRPIAPAAAEQQMQSPERARWVLIGSCLALFVLMLDSTEVVLALPVISKDLHMSPAGVQWVQNAYLLMLATAVITCGRLGDIFGRRTVFNAGLLVFAAGTILAAVSGSELELIVARLIQGLGGAAMFALSLAIASNAFPKERQATAVGIWAAISSIAMGVGPLLGGVLVQSAGWRWIFWTYLPFLAIGAVILHRNATNNRDTSAPQTLDIRGLVTVSAGLALTILALVELDSWGVSPLSVGVFAAGIAFLALFYVVEHRVANPLVDFLLFRNRPYFGASIAALALVGSYWTTMFFEPQYLQGNLGYSVIEAGILILPVTVPMVFLSPFTGKWMERIGPRRMIVSGLVFATLALAAIVAVTGSGGYGLLFVPYLAYGIALALLYAPVSAAAMAAMPREKAGIAAGVMGMLRLMSGALILALSGALFQAAGSTPHVPARAFQAALIAPTLLLALGAVFAWRLMPAGEHKHEPAIAHHRMHF